MMIAATTTQAAGGNEIHLWVRRVSQSFDEYEALLPAERTRASRIVLPEKRAQFVTGRALARRTLAAVLGIDPLDVPIEISDNGRPRLAAALPLDFNVSHSRGLVLLGLAWHTRIAVDIEAIRPARAHTAIADRFFSSSERALLASAPRDRRHQVFYDIWTCKEAYIKVLGLGVFSHLSATSVAPYEGRVAVGIDGDAPGRWRLAALEIASAHRASVCWEARVPEAWRIRVHDERG